MKKLLYSIMALAGLTMASCTQEHIDVQYIPENAVAPTLGAIEGCDLSEGGADIVVEYTKADFGVATASGHNLYIAKSEDMADMKKAKATFTDTTITFTQADLNVVALDFAEAGAELDLYFAVVANLNTDKGAAVAGSDLRSNVVKATFKSYVADVLPTEKFDKVWVIGNYCGWDHSKTQFLFDYTASGNVYSGVIDFADAEGVSLANTGFKLTGVAKWDDTCNWGLEDNTTAEAEAASLQLITGGGSQDIKCYAKRFYGFEFDNTTLVLKKAWGADQIGIIGLNGDWETDIVMEYNPKWTRFYADIDAAAATEMKFRADAGWDLNWGVDCAQGGDNIAVPAGQYRVYFNPATGLIEFNAKNYGTDEDTGAGTGTTPEPEPTETTYGLIGSFNGWGEPDVDLIARGDGWYVVEDVVIPAAEENKFLIRLNDAWSNKFGFAEDNTFVTIDAKNTLTAEGKDMWIAAGTYDFYFNPTSAELYVMTAGAADPTLPSDAKAVKVYADVKAAGWENCNIYGWGDLGEFAGTWAGTAMTAEGDYFVYQFDATAYGKTVSIVLNNGNGDQTVDIKDIVLNDDVVITLTDNEGGKWNYTVNGEAPVTPEPPAETTYGLIGDFNGWGTDVDLVARGDGWYVTTALEVGADGKFLIRLNDAWSNKFGFAEDNTFVTIDAKNTLTAEGKDMWIAAGTYDFYFNPEASELYVMTAGAADPTLPSEAKAVKLYAHKEGAAWAEMALYGWDGYDFGAWPGILLTEKETIDGKEFFVYEFPVSAYGITTNIIFNNNNNGEQTQDITGVVLNRDYYYIIPAEAENGKFMAYEMGTEPVKPSFPVLTEHSWGVVGSFNNWGSDVAMEIVDGVATATIEIADTDDAKKFKVRADGVWTNNFGYSATAEAPLAPVDGTEFAATFNGSDIVVEAAGKYEVALRIENEQGYLKITKL